MYFFLPDLNLALAVGSLFLAVITIVLYVDYFLWKGKYFSDTIKEVSWPVLISVTIGSVVMSLVYSEYFGFVPCSLCWLQRIAIYPQALLSVLAFKVQDHTKFPVYGIGLSLFGFVVAVYHYIYQALPRESSSSALMPCLVDGSNADCAVKVMNVFGFVTFPFLSAVTFAFLIILYLYMLRLNKGK